jgi:hypothetical protein
VNRLLSASVRLPIYPARLRFVSGHDLQSCRIGASEASGLRDYVATGKRIFPWNKAFEFGPNQPRRRGSALSPGRKPRREREIDPSRAAANHSRHRLFSPCETRHDACPTVKLDDCSNQISMENSELKTVKGKR